jgi:hypothetical protein
MLEKTLDEKIKEMYGDDPNALEIAMDLKVDLLDYLKNNPTVIITNRESEAFVHGVLFAYKREKKENKDRKSELDNLGKNLNELKREITQLKTKIFCS